MCMASKGRSKEDQGEAMKHRIECMAHPWKKLSAVPARCLPHLHCATGIYLALQFCPCSTSTRTLVFGKLGRKLLGELRKFYFDCIVGPILLPSLPGNMDSKIHCNKLALWILI